MSLWQPTSPSKCWCCQTLISEDSDSHPTGQFARCKETRHLRAPHAPPRAQHMATAPSIADYFVSLPLWCQAQLPTRPGWILAAVNLSVLSHLRSFKSRNTITFLKKPRDEWKSRGDGYQCEDEVHSILHGGLGLTGGVPLLREIPG